MRSIFDYNKLTLFLLYDDKTDSGEERGGDGVEGFQYNKDRSWRQINRVVSRSYRTLIRLLNKADYGVWVRLNLSPVHVWGSGMCPSVIISHPQPPPLSPVWVGGGGWGVRTCHIIIRRNWKDITVQGS